MITIGGSTRCQPWATPMPSGASDPMATPITVLVSTSSPDNCWVCRKAGSPAMPPTSGMAAPSTEYAPRTISCGFPDSPSDNSIIALYGLSTSLMAAAAAAPAPRWPSSSIRAVRVRTVKPLPPIAATATPSRVAPSVDSSPSVVAPTIGTSGPASLRTAASSAERSYEWAAKTKTAPAVRPASAVAVASAPACTASGSTLLPAPNQRPVTVCMFC